MALSNFINNLGIRNYDEELFSSFKETVFGELVEVKYISVEKMKKVTAKEKLYDYFEKIELKTGKDIELIKLAYINNLKSVVESGIIPELKQKDKTTSVCRARKYYYHARLKVANDRNLKSGLGEFTRVMLCLYMAIINNDHREIEDFDFSLECVDIDRIISSMKSEKDLKGNPKLFPENPFSCDRCMLVMLAVIYFYLINSEVV